MPVLSRAHGQSPSSLNPRRRRTVKIRESNQDYVSLNDGLNRKGEPDGTLSAQDTPQLKLGAVPPRGTPPTPDSFARYDRDTGTYFGADGRVCN